MFRFTQEPSSASYKKCLAKTTAERVGTGVVSVMAVYCDVMCVCSTVRTDTHSWTRLVILAKHLL